MEHPRETWFDHERLDVYQEAIAFVAWLAEMLDGLHRTGDVRDQLDRASSSIVLNIAEGNGKNGSKDRCKYLDNAHGSALECAAGLDVLVARRKVAREQIRPGKERLSRIVKMLFGLLKYHSDRHYPSKPVESSSSS